MRYRVRAEFPSYNWVGWKEYMLKINSSGVCEMNSLKREVYHDHGCIDKKNRKDGAYLLPTFG